MMQYIRHAVYYLVLGSAGYRVIKETEQYCARKAIQAKVQGLVYKVYEGTSSAVHEQCTRTGYSSQCAMFKEQCACMCVYSIRCCVLCRVLGMMVQLTRISVSTHKVQHMALVGQSTLGW